MQIRNLLTIGAVFVFFAGLGEAKTHHSGSHANSGVRHASAHRTSRNSSHRARRGAWKRHGQQGIQGDRATEIQQALIREKYLDGSPTGAWDTRTQQAMAHYQADHGWQSKVTPDSRALIKLGLGPSHEKDIVTLEPVSTSTDAGASAAASNSSRR